MTLWDWVKVLFLVTLSAIWVVCFVVFYIHTAPAERPKRAIDPAIRAEIEQTMEWWDGEFRKLSGEPEPRKPYINGAARVEFSAPTTAELNLCREHEYVEERSFANTYVRVTCINCGDWEMEEQ